MTLPRDPDEILAAWLDEGPFRLPDATRRAIGVSTRTTRQTRRRLGPWRYPVMQEPVRLALGAVAVVAVALGGLYLLGGPGNGVGAQPSPPTSAIPSDSAAPSPPPSALPAMTRTFRSPLYGYSIKYPAESWTVTPASTFFEPVAFAAIDGPSSWMDVVKPATAGLLRIASAAVPDGEDGATWIAKYYGDCSPGCQDVVIAGRPARLGEDENEIEATMIVGDRAYVFTLFAGEGALQDPRALFDAFMATVELHPQDALAAPTTGPSASP